jgi:hypothetical protein
MRAYGFPRSLVEYFSRRGTLNVQWGSTVVRSIITNRRAVTCAQWQHPLRHTDICTARDIGPPRLRRGSRTQLAPQPGSACISMGCARLGESVQSRQWNSRLVLPPDPASGCLDWLASLAAQRATSCSITLGPSFRR